ncbi:MAG: hypothetical protein IK122_03995 [Alphaproteobacteria bacterium]|nr:hypothetical protein [Alphaproteobacteria bacterium]
MKRYFILTSVLALAACGAGSGGGGIPSAAPARVAIVAGSPAAESNSAITSMASEVLVANGTAITPSRSATASYNGKTYKSYRLDDVHFKMAGEDSEIRFGLDSTGKIISAGKYDKNSSGRYVLNEQGTFARSGDTASFGSAKTLYGWNKTLTSDNVALKTAITNKLDELNLTTPDWLDDDTKLTAVVNDVKKHFKDGVEATSDNGGLGNTAVANMLKSNIAAEITDWANSQPGERQGDVLTAVAAAVQAYYQAQITGSFGDPTAYTAKLDVQGVDAGLKYADLGFAHLRVSNANESDVKEDGYSPYVGGYDALKKTQLATEKTFTGTAVAGIDGVDDGMLVRQDNAKLTMYTTGASKLVMDNLVAVDDDHSGDQWYNVTIETAAGAAPKFTIDDNGRTVGADFALETIAPKGTEGYNELVVNFADGGTYNPSEGRYEIHGNPDGDGISTNYGGSMETAMYGAGNTPEEATARFGFSENQHDAENNQRHVAIYGAFGGK